MTNFNYKSKELYLNLDKKDIPPKGHPDFGEFVKWEKKKCREGVTIGGIYLPGTLYFKTQHLQMDIDSGRDGSTERKHFTLMDSDWIIHNAMYRANQSDPKEKLMLLASRQLGKSLDQAVFLLHSLQFYKNSNALLLVDEKTAVSNVTRYLDIFMSTMTPEIKVPLLDKDFDKSEVRFGVKGVDNTDIVWNILFIRNVQGGAKTEVSAGTTIRTACIDEIGRFKWSQAYSALEPAMKGSFGLRNAPFLTGTGGDFTKGEDAKKHFLKPHMMNLQKYTQDDGVETGLFLSNDYRRDAKDLVNLKDYISINNDTIFQQNVIGKLTNKKSELDDLKILVKNPKKAEEIYNKELQGYLDEGEQEEALKYQMYYPKYYGDVFLSKSNNRFYREGLLNHLEYVTNNFKGELVDLYKDYDGKIKFKFSNKIFNTDFPVLPNSLFKDAPIIIYDHPRYKDKYYAIKSEVGGLDPYSTDETQTSDSLGSIYIIRRRNTNILDDPFQDTMVASYTARPKTMKEFHQNVELLLEYYNCTVLHEASTHTFLQYFDNKNKGHYIEDCIQLQREINPTSKVITTKGLPPTKGNKEFRYTLVENYLDEETHDGKPGYTRILNPVLIKQLLAYNPDNKKFNADDLDAFSYALTHLHKERKYNPIVSFIPVSKEEEKKVNYSRNFFDVAPKTYNFEEENYNKGFF